MTDFALGWTPSLPDHRDLCAVELMRGILPTARPGRYSMRQAMPPVTNQKSLGSCVSQTVRAALEFTGEEMGGDGDLPSSLFIYYNGRVLHNTVNSDSGLSIRNGFKSVAKWGYCDESYCPYVIADFKKKPSKAAYADAAFKKLKDAMYASVPQDLDAMRDVLAANNPIAIGFSVFSSFDRVGRNGLVPYPGMNEKVRGGHAVLVTGYDDEKGVFEFRNSWGTGWGNAGYGYFKYEHLTNRKLASDFWTVVSVPRLRNAAAA